MILQKEFCHSPGIFCGSGALLLFSPSIALVRAPGQKTGGSTWPNDHQATHKADNPECSICASTSSFTSCWGSFPVAISPPAALLFFSMPPWQSSELPLCFSSSFWRFRDFCLPFGFFVLAFKKQTNKQTYFYLILLLKLCYSLLPFGSRRSVSATHRKMLHTGSARVQ